MRWPLLATSRRRPCRGYTLLEVLISTSILAMLGWALADAALMAESSHSAVESGTSSNRALRKATALISSDLKGARSSTLALTPGLGGNSQLIIEQAIEVGGNPAWGVHERRLGPTVAQQSREDWTLRYAAVDTGAGAEIERRLVRQILNETGDVMLEDTVLRRLAAGGIQGGFVVAPTGGVWEIALRTIGGTQGNEKFVRFQVRTRN